MEKICKQCNQRMERKRYNERLEDLTIFKKRIFCGPNCYAESKIIRPISMVAFKERMLEELQDKQKG